MNRSNTIGKGVKWRVCRETDAQRLTGFLRSYEWAWTGFTSRLMPSQGVTANRHSSDTILVCEVSNTLSGAVYVTRHGLLLPALHPSLFDTACNAAVGAMAGESSRPERISTHTSDSSQLRECIRNRRVHTVMGLSRDVAALSAILTRPPRASIEYHLMKLDRWDRTHPPVSGIQIRRALRRDLRKLMPLQAAYEKEEVLLDPSSYNPSITRAHLLQTLNEQIVVMASARDTVEPHAPISGPLSRSPQPIAKASTNAKGIDYHQIGGVFTQRMYRGRGIGGSVVAFLLDTIFEDGRRACLFVKKDNIPALAMYRRLGFEKAGEYRIDYYR